MYTSIKNAIKPSLSGFTLIELLVVVFIIGVLFTLVLPNFNGARERAQDANMKQTMNAMRTALGLYYNDMNSYPVPTSGELPTNFFPTYMPEAVNGVGFTYSYATTAGGGFLIGSTLSTIVGDDDTNSQARCQVTITAPANQGMYYVCAR